MALRLVFVFFLTGFFSACKTAEDYLSDGEELSSSGNFSAAFLIFEKAIEKNPFLEDAYIQMGLCQENLKHYDFAIGIYLKLLYLNPENTAAYYYSGICKYKQEKFEDAIRLFNRAIDTKGGYNTADTTSIQALINMNKDNFETESAGYDIPSNEILYNRGMAYYKTGQLKNARFDFAQCILKDYNTGASHFMLGLCRLVSKRRNARTGFAGSSPLTIH